ncbi:UbiX family flavin prenyltransferase [Myxococcota bacterium]|nr:UbiX family flavin prenyltransferase [Myxococcota bacterium]MBU1380768.1 UbiX family flavin prenyltransferase [Myxococcota bacterium]MBU1498902.1 UbiX family flavin prenyltransferase [Myxococcota bacterium]
MKHIFLAVSGASGSIYASKAAAFLKSCSDVKLHITISPAGRKIFLHELGQAALDEMLSDVEYLHDYDDMASSVASGSFPLAGAAIIPCSLSSAMSIAAGLANNLSLRVAQVALKEKLPLVLLIRETPLDAIHLENLALLSRSGAVIMPASPQFYSKPSSIDDLASETAGRALKYLGIEVPDLFHWG